MLHWGWAGLLVFLPGVCLAGDSSVVTFEESVKDLGGIPRGNKPVYHFKFTNTSGQPVHVSGVRTSCHCSTAWAVKPDVAPGESSSIGVRIDTNLYQGARDFTIYVTFDRPILSEMRLLLKTVSRDDIALTPTELNYGVVKLGSAPTAEVTLEHRTLAGWKITGIENENGYLQPKLEPLSGGSGYKLSVRLREDTPAGLWHAAISLITNDPSTPRIQVPLAVEVQGLLSVTPQILSLGRLGDAATQKKIVVRGARPFRIIGVEGADALVSVEPARCEEAKIAHVLTITYSGKAGPGELNRKLTFVTDLDQTRAEVSIQGEVVK